MRKFNFVLWLLVLHLAGSAYGARILTGTIVRLSDGDTVKFRPQNQLDLWSFNPLMVDILDAKKDMTIRLIGMDAPEVHVPAQGGWVGQGDWGTNATDFLAKIVGKLPMPAMIEDHGTDKYGRTLGRLFVNKSDMDYQMVVGGHAVTYFLCGEGECSENFIQEQKVMPYVVACQEAKRAGRGMWEPAHELSEMPFEFRLRVQNRKPEKFVGDLMSRRYFAPEDYKKIPVCNRIFFMEESDARVAGFHR